MIEGAILFYLNLAGTMGDQFLLLHRHDAYEIAKANATCRGITPEVGLADMVNSGGRFIEVDGPLLPDEGLSVFIGYDFKPKRKYPIRKD